MGAREIAPGVHIHIGEGCLKLKSVKGVRDCEPASPGPPNPISRVSALASFVGLRTSVGLTLVSRIGAEPHHGISGPRERRTQT